MEGGAKGAKPGNKTKHITKGKGKPVEITWQDVLEKAKATIRAINEKRTTTAPPQPPIEEVGKPEPPLPRAGKESASERDKALFGAFVADIPNVSEEEKEQAIVILKKLAFFDSIHDFWPKRGTGSSGDKKALADEDEDAPLDIDPNRIVRVHENLLSSIKSYVEPPKGGAPAKPKTRAELEAEAKDRELASSAADILRRVTASSVGSVHGIEEKFIEYLKRNFAPFNEPEYVIKVSEVLSKWRFDKDYESNWAKYSSAIKTLPTTVQILLDGTQIKSLDAKQLGILGFFILACMDPNKQPGTGEDEYFTFDMGPRDIGKIFAGFTQVKNAMFPQNVADSAKTSFTALEGRNVFFRANGQRSDKTKGEVIQPILANTFTFNKYALEFVDTGFSEKNKFGFSIRVTSKKTKKEVGTIKFGPGSEQGPSVNYLMDILSKGTIAGVVAPPKVARLDGLKEFDKDLLFDIKRMGDQEQMRVKSARGITGDHFASVFRRTLRMPGIFHSIKMFRVWRAPLELLTPAKIRQNAIDFRKKKIIEKLKIIAGLRGIGDRVQTVRDDLLKMYDEISFGVERGFVFKAPIPLQGQLSRGFIGEFYTDIASTFATYLLRMRMRDMLEQVALLIMRVEGLEVGLGDIDTAACLLDQPRQTNPGEACPPPAGAPNLDAIEAALDTLEAYTEQVEVLRNLNISFTLEKDASGVVVASGPEIYTPLFAANGQLRKGATSVLFNFSSDSFVHPEFGFAPVVARLLDISNTKGSPARIAKKINELLVHYFQSRDAIKEAFYDEFLKQEAEELTDITSGLAPDQVIAVDNDGGLIGAINRIVNKFGNMQGGGEADVQEGGAEGDAVATAWSALQYRDLHDLFFELCLEARLSVENKESPLEALDAIEATWITELDQIRAQSKDVYGKEYESSTAAEFVSFLLSFRTTEESLFQISPEVAERDRKQFTKVHEALSAKPNREEFILQVLTGFGENIKKERQKYASREGWKGLPGAIETFMINQNPSEEVLKLLAGGGLDDDDSTPSNEATSAGSSRRRLYQGLRKRAGSGSSSEL